VKRTVRRLTEASHNLVKASRDSAGCAKRRGAYPVLSVLPTSPRSGLSLRRAEPASRERGIMPPEASRFTRRRATFSSGVKAISGR
jgi:hypothetical protein